MSYDTSPPALRASDADREAAADRLRHAAGEGRLDALELDERLTAVYASRLCSELTALTRDVTPPAPRTVAGPPVFVRAPRSTNGFAVASLLCGVLWMWWIGSVLAVIFGHVALRQINRSGQAGRGLAVGGLVLGYIGALMFLVALLSFAVG